jgi:cephalosporin hydroxylase
MLKDLFKKRKFTLKDLSILNKYKSLYKTSLREWLIYHHKEIVFNNMHWMGVRILKNPMDLWVYQEILFEVKPDIVIEIGSANGGSTLYLANILDCLNSGKIISIDIDRSNYKVSHERIVCITGDSLSEEVINEVKSLCLNKKVLVIHDGDHTEESVYKNLIIYSEFVTSKSYFIVEDSIIDIFTVEEGIGGHSGPLNAVLEFLKVNQSFTIDDKREKYLLTYNQCGFLKRN